MVDFTHYPKWHYDLYKSLDGVEVKTKPAVVLHEKEIHSFLSAAYTFEHAEGKVGELCPSQFSVTSSALPAAAPVTISEVHVNFEGSMKPLVLKHQSESNTPHGASKGICFERVSLNETTENGRPVLVGSASLTFAPGQTKVFDFDSFLREAGDATAISATFYIASELFDLEYVHNFRQTNAFDVWYGEKAIRKRIIRDNASAIKVLPKPPKIELQFSGLQEQYYTNEEVVLQLQVINGEDEDSIVSLEVRLFGESAPPVSLRLANASNQDEDNDEGDEETGIPLGQIKAGEATTVQVIIPALNLPIAYDLSMKVTYHLVSDLETPVYRSMSKQFEFINPFEANYDFSPRIHPDPWPSLFVHDQPKDDSTNKQEIHAQGLAQKWCLAARYASFATDDLIVEDLDVKFLGMNGGIQCHTKKLTTIPEGGLKVVPKSLEEALFDTFTQKISLDDRGTATLDVSLAIKWRRDIPGSPLNTSVLAVPRLLVSSSEPRVLGAVSYSTKIPSMIHFDVMIENPSNHFLTFGISMEPSEKFAFSGTKQSTLQLVPLSRRTTRFRLLPTVRGEWIGPVQCVIRDRYFQKVLKIAPTEGMRIDKEGIFCWAPPDEEDL